MWDSLSDWAMSDSSPALSALRWLLDLVLQGTLLLFLAGGAALLLRRASAALRHLVWLLALGGLLALPLLGILMPRHLTLLRPAAAPPVVPQTALVFGSETTAPVEVSASRQRAVPPPLDRPDQSSGLWGREVWPFYGLGLWLSGMLLACTRVVVGLHGIRCLERESIALLSGPLVELAHEAQQALPCKRPVTLRMALPDAGIMVPLTWGWRRPVVLLPSDAQAWPPMRQRAVLLHELAHVARVDWLALLAAQVACALYWFHPLAWRAAHSLRAESERATDDRVLAAGVRAGDYGECLLEFVRLLSATPRRPIMKLAIAIARPSTLENRLLALLDARRNRRGVTRLNVLCGTGVAMLMALGVATVRVTGQAQESAPGATTPATAAASRAVDLSSPEATVRSFVAALNRVDLEAASACVAGGQPASQLSRLKPGIAGFAKSKVTIVSLHEKTTGEASDVSFDLAIDDGTPKKNTMADRLPLRRYGGGWKIVPGKPASLSARQYKPSLLPIATAIAAPEALLALAIDRAEKDSCLSNLKQLGLAGLQFRIGHGDRFTLKAATFKKSLGAYCRGADGIFHCPTNKSGADSYAFNRKLEGVKSSAITKPAETVMIYEGKNGRLNFRHKGRAGLYAGVAFVDGHVRMYNREEAKSLRWKP